MLSRRKPWTRQPDLVPRASTRSQVDKGPARKARHLSAVRGMHCLACEKGKQATPTESHYCRHLSPKTFGKRVSDYLTVPLCRWHHQDSPSALHKGDEASWWIAMGIDPRTFIRTFSREGRETLEAIEQREAA